MILFVTDSFLRFQKAEMGQYFNPQMELLAAEGIHHFEMIWSDDLPLAESAAKLREVILRHTPPVILVGHGKGGLDILECLVRYPELRPRVQKFVCVQAPIWGTPLADYLTGHPIMNFVTHQVVKVIGGSVKALEEVSEFSRQVYMIIHRQEIQKVLTQVPVVTVGSTFEWTKKSETWFDRVSKYFYRLILKHAGPNDGLVPAQSTRILGEPHIELDNVTHLGAVTLPNHPEMVELTKEVLQPISNRPTGLKRPQLKQRVSDQFELV